jgi:beta-phosphoglucomutase-like phosphatase (HAD superfamily)
VNFDILNDIATDKHDLVIVSGSRIQTIKVILEYHKVSNLFSRIISAESSLFSKPHPMPFFLGMEGTIDTQFYLGIEDSISGLQSVHSAGLSSIGVHNDKIRDLCDWYFDDINEFLFKFYENPSNYSGR